MDYMYVADNYLDLDDSVAGKSLAADNL